MSRYDLKDITKEKYLKVQARRIKYLINNIIIKQDDVWYDAGMQGGRVRTYLEEQFDMEALTFTSDLNEPLKARDNCVHVITHLEVIEHLLNPLLNMSECYRILKPGGKLYLTTPNDYSFTLKLEHLLERKFMPHFHQFNEMELEWLLIEAGFKKFKIRTFKKTNRGFIARWCRNSFFVEATK